MTLYQMSFVYREDALRFRMRITVLREQAKAAHPELQPVAIEMIEESEQSDLADTFDYYYVPTFYVDGVKVHEGGIYAEEVEKILRSALE